MNFEYMWNFMDRLTSWRIPGNVISIYKDGKKVFEYCSGFSNIESGEKMTADKYFYLYSCSKITTTLAAMQLYEKGMFLLNDPLYDFIPEFKDMTVRKNGGTEKCAGPITMRHLFTMTAGFNYNFDCGAFKKAKEITNGHYNTVDTIKCLAAEPLDFEPGEKWQYSLAHDVLAAAVEVISGKKFRDYVRENIFDPLGITASYHDGVREKQLLCTQYRFCDGGDKDIVKAQSGAVNKNIGGKIEIEGLKNTHILGDEYDSGGAGIITSVPEYAKLCAAVANGGELNGERIISRGTIDLWRTNQLDEKQAHYFNWPQLAGYGYGLGVRTMIDRAKGGSNGALGECGWGGAAGANALIDPDNNISFFYAHHMLNNQEGYVQPRLRNVLYACMG